MKYRFGQFELDEPARALILRGREQALQPRVFDLLLYLVKNGGRVVPKEELLDALWPGVIVTESSLQRAASLARRALAEGGLGEAIQNFAKRGYRFAIDDARLGRLAPGEPAVDGFTGLARQAAVRREWNEASAFFARAALAAPLAADDLDLWALCDECRGRPADGIPALGRAVEAHLAAGRPVRAARAAVTLAKIELERGSSAPAQGWLDRAATILAGVTDDAAHAHLLWMQGRLAGASQPEEALRLASQSVERARKAGDQGLLALTLVYQGFYHLSLGAIAEGSRLQNHAAAIALSSGVDPMTGTLVYCNILWACRTFADWERALQWSDGFEAWCSASFQENPGSCDLHRAEVLGNRGTLDEAVAKITNALPRLADEESWALGEGHRIRGDLAAMVGDVAAAEADYAMAYALGWDAEPGNAVLLHERGHSEAALSALDRAMEGRGWFQLQRRGVLLANAARIAALSGQLPRAQRYLDAIGDGGERWQQPPLRALATEAHAALLPEGDPRGTQLRVLARQLWTSARIDYHAARVRLDLARAAIRAGETLAAETELNAADHTARRLGSRRLLAESEAIRAEAAGFLAPRIAIGER